MEKKPFLITATIENRRKYFCIFAVDSAEAVRVFNKNYPNTEFKNLKELKVLK